MHSVGIDLHRKRSHVAALDASGAQLLSRRIVNDPQTILARSRSGGVVAEAGIPLSDSATV